LSTPTLTIRPRLDSDMPAITVIYAHHVLHGASSWELTPPDQTEMTNRAHTLLAAGYPYLVALQDGVIVGYAYAGAYRPRPAYRNTVEHSIYIDDAARRGGIGKALMVALIEACTTLGFRQMIAIIGDSKNLQSIEFHEQMGFEHVGRVKDIGYKFDRWMDQIIMQRALGDGAGSAPNRL
jgi:L-amino acid N-acyltransferase YncA